MKTSITLDNWRDYTEAWCKVALAMVGRGEIPPSPPFIQGLLGIPVSKKKTVSPPKINYLGWMLPQLPPVMARRDMEKWLPGVSPKTLANADSNGTGPRVRYQHHNSIIYPTAYLLEWIEKSGIELHVRDHTGEGRAATPRIQDTSRRVARKSSAT